MPDPRQEEVERLAEVIEEAHEGWVTRRDVRRIQPDLWVSVAAHALAAGYTLAPVAPDVRACMTCGDVGWVVEPGHVCGGDEVACSERCPEPVQLQCADCPAAPATPERPVVVLEMEEGVEAAYELWCDHPGGVEGWLSEVAPGHNGVLVVPAGHLASVEWVGRPKPLPSAAPATPGVPDGAVTRGRYHPGHGPFLCRPGCPDFDPAEGRPAAAAPGGAPEPQPAGSFKTVDLPGVGGGWGGQVWTGPSQHHSPPAGGAPEEPNGGESFTAIRRTDGEPVGGEYGWYDCGGPHDWQPALDDAESWVTEDIEGDPPVTIEYEMVRMVVQPLGRRTITADDFAPAAPQSPEAPSGDR